MADRPRNPYELTSRASSTTIGSETPPIILSDDEDDDATKEDDDDDLEVIELTPAEWKAFDREQQKIKQLLGPQSDLRPQNQATLSNGDIILPRMSVECSNGDFFLVERIMGRGAEAKLLGYKLLRNGNVEKRQSAQSQFDCYSFLPRKANELCIVMQVNPGDETDLHNLVGVKVMDISDVDHIREIIFTNTLFPTFSDQRKIQHPQFVCRRKYVQEIDRSKRVQATRFENLSEREADSGNVISDVLKRRNFLDKRANNHSQQTTLTSVCAPPEKGSYVDLTADSEEFRLPKRRDRGTNPTPVLQCKAKYTFTDICCGAGFATYAAAKAGLLPKLAVDKAKYPCKTIKKNNQTMVVLHRDVSDFIAVVREMVTHGLRWEVQNDVLHISPPCQGHSFMNRGQNPDNDAINNAVIFAVGPLVQLLKPRRVTIEQTSGITAKNESQFFRALIYQLTELGFSVAYQILDSKNYGDPLPRKRLFVLASCPGETLPSFPPPKHGHGPGLRPFVTLNERLATVRSTATLHNVAEERYLYRTKGYGRTMKRANGNGLLAGTIMTAGCNELHPDGDRRFTEREQIAIMGLPNHYRIVGRGTTVRKRQIGNGVTIGVFTAIMKEVIKSLVYDDEVAAQYTPKVITIDD